MNERGDREHDTTSDTTHSAARGGEGTKMRQPPKTTLPPQLYNSIGNQPVEVRLGLPCFAVTRRRRSASRLRVRSPDRRGRGPVLEIPPHVGIETDERSQSRRHTTRKYHSCIQTCARQMRGTDRRGARTLCSHAVLSRIPMLPITRRRRCPRRCQPCGSAPGAESLACRAP